MYADNSPHSEGQSEEIYKAGKMSRNKHLVPTREQRTQLKAKSTRQGKEHKTRQKGHKAKLEHTRRFKIQNSKRGRCLLEVLGGRCCEKTNEQTRTLENRKLTNPPHTHTTHLNVIGKMWPGRHLEAAKYVQGPSCIVRDGN